VTAVDAREVGLCAVAMGAGRMVADQAIDPSAGIELLAKPGDRVALGGPLARMHMREPSPELSDRLARAFQIGSRPPRPRPLVLERITLRTR
jgi:thymidine phosphorylase